MRPMVLLALVAWPAFANGGEPASSPMSADDCVAVALRQSPKLREVDADVASYRARLAEVQAVYHPKLRALAWVSPMFTVHGSALQHDVEREYGPADWGPYTHLEAILGMPIYTFGRVEAGEDAAKHRMEVEKARRRIVMAEVALEVRKLYYTAVFARSMIPGLESAHSIVIEAEALAKEKYEQGTGEVTQPDLAKIAYGRAELERYIRIAKDGEALAKAALAHAMGMAPVEHMELTDTSLPMPSGDEPPPLAELLERAARQRPEWAQLSHGAKAAVSLADAERLADTPAILLAGTLTASWTPTRDDSPNPYHYDPYNDLFGGVALAVQWDFDPARTSARVAGAEALARKVEALEAFAKSGIPLQVFKAREDVERHRDLSRLAKESVTATRRWMTFASAAYQMGTGEAKDLLEGLVAYVQAKKTYYEHLRDYHVAEAELRFAVGDDVAATPGVEQGAH